MFVLGARGRVWDEQAARGDASARPPGQRSQVHGRLPQAANLLLTLQGFHLVRTYLRYLLHSYGPEGTVPVPYRSDKLANRSACLLAMMRIRRLF